MTDPDVIDSFTDSPDYLAFWHPVADDEIDESYLDWGPIAAGSSADTTLRVRNCSANYWARAVQITVADTGTPGIADQHLLSADGSRFTPSCLIGDIAPLTVSAPFTLRRVTWSAATYGPATFQLIATPGTWS